MKIWTIKEGEPLPIDICKGRIMRCGIISQMLSNRNHEVTWWSSTFIHQTKTCISKKDVIYNINHNFRLNLINTKIKYMRNISILRILYSKNFAIKFKKKIAFSEKPSVIYCSFPLIDIAYEATKYAIKNNIPIVIDVRDLWPDIIYDKFPKILTPILKLILFNMEYKTKYILNNATCVTATVPFDLEWAMRRRKVQSAYDQYFYMGYNNMDVSSNFNKEFIKIMNDYSIKKTDFIICYFGNITNTVINYNLILQCAETLKEFRDIKILICGTGVYFEKLKRRTAGFENIILTSYISGDTIKEIMSISSLGILPYYDTWDFKDALPNKAIEYFSGNLPILTELSGFLYTLLKNNKCGMLYKNAEELKNEIIFFKNNPRILDEYKENVKNYFQLNFTAEHVYGNFCNLIEKIAMKGGIL